MRFVSLALVICVQVGCVHGVHRGEFAMDEMALKAEARALVAAYDRSDVAASTALLGPAFVRFTRLRFEDRLAFEHVLETRAQRHEPVVKRTWSDEHVFISSGSAVWVARSEDSYHTLVFAPDVDRWRAVLWQVASAGIAAERDQWNEYFQSGDGYSHQPNQLLVDSVKGVAPGAALDLEMGQGRNAVFLARAGWRVTGVDISDEGIRMAREVAAGLHVTLDTVNAPVERYDLGEARWDLVTLIYAGNDPALVKRAQTSLRPGGLFICEFFEAGSEIARSGAGGWRPGELARLFAGFDILRDEVVNARADWAGQPVTPLVRFVARKR